MALERAQRMEEDGFEDGMDEGGGGGQRQEDTVLAEVLSEMHTQTRMAIDGAREDFPR